HSTGQCYGITAGLSGPGALGEPADESDAGRFSQPIDVDAAKPADVGAVAFRQPAIPGRAVGVAEPDEGGCAGNDARSSSANHVALARRNRQPLEIGGRSGRRTLPDRWAGDDFSATSGEPCG